MHEPFFSFWNLSDGQYWMFAPWDPGGRRSELEVILSPSAPWGGWSAEVLGKPQNRCPCQVHLDLKRLTPNS